MKKLFCVYILIHITSLIVFSQAKTRRLPGVINHPSLNLYAPYISHDGNALLFVSNNGEDGALVVSYTSRENDWIEPVELPKNINNRLTFIKGYSLSADGKKLYFTSAKSPVVGGYDIMSSDLKGKTWSEPQNFLLPINSKANEGCPSVSIDGNTIYFMRCDKMDQNKATGCKLFQSDKKPNGQWGEPSELAENINTGNSQSPRIMADNETLIFSSDKMSGTKGGMDLFLTRRNNGSWSDPVPLDFANTDKDDQFVSAAALGRYLLKEAPGKKNNNELVEFLFPNELRPKGMMKVEGKITDTEGSSVPSYITITDLTTAKKVYSGRPGGDGSYFLYLREGSKYEMSVDPEKSNVAYFSKQVDLMSEKIPQKEKVNVVLKAAAAGDEFPLDLVQFRPATAQLESSSETELKRLARLIRANPQLRFEIQVMLNGYEEDSVKSSPELSEFMMDSIRSQIDAIDSLGMPIKRDTVIARTIYHNDRTLIQGKAIVDQLIKYGADATGLKYFGNAIPALLPENKKLTVKAVAHAK